MRIVVSGPSGAGKTTVGRLVSARLAAAFVDADDLHPSTNIAAMAAGAPLDDAMREPWLDEVARRLQADPEIVVACSALARRYRDRIARICPDTVFVVLEVPRDVLHRRMRAREHFMPPALLDSQLAAWEPLASTERGVVVDGCGTPEEVAARVVLALAVALPSERPEGADGGDESEGREQGDDAEHQV